MNKRFLGLGLLVTVFALLSVSGVIGQQSRRAPASAKPAPAVRDLKLKYKMTTGGQTMESTTMVKGKRERSEMRTGYMDTVSITQCDLKRTIQLSDKAQKYVITPMEGDDSSQPSPATTSVSQPAGTRAGGTVTYTTSAVDTGERKEMFGFTARHVKSSMTIESSPDACNPVKQRTETDGWYIDAVFEFQCDTNRTPMMSPHMASGCRDKALFRRTGAAKTGYPLTETMTMYGPDGNVMFTTSREVVELSRDPLDAALFDIPAGYTEAASTQELYVMPGMGAPMGDPSATTTATSQMADSSSSMMSGNAKQSGAIRVGVVSLNNKAGKPISLDELRGRLLGGIQSSGIDAVPLNAISQSEAEVEAKAKQCDFILYTDLSLKSSSGAKKLGGMFGRAAGVQGVDTSEAKVDFKLFAVGESSPRLQSSATAKEEGDEASAGTAIDAEARAVVGAVGRRG